MDQARRARLQLVAKAVEPATPTMIIGTTGLKESGGRIDEEFLTRLRGVQGVNYFREMLDNNSTVGAMAFVINSLIRQVPWRIAPNPKAKDESAAIKEAEFITTCLHDMSHTFEDFVSEAFSFLYFGWSYFETVLKLRKGDTNDPTTQSEYADGRFGWRKLETRGQNTLWSWEFDPEDRSLLGMWQLDQYAGKGARFIPIEKSILFRTETTKGNPEGRSLLRSAAPDHHNLKRIKEFELIGIERDLAGMPIFEVPREILLPDASPEDQALRRQLEDMIQRVKVDEHFGGLVPSEDNSDGTKSGYRFKLVTTGGRKSIDTNEIIKRIESRVAMTFLGDFVLVGHEKVGTQSLFQGKSNLFGVALGTYLDIFASTVNRFAIGPLCKMNGVPRDQWPLLEHGDAVGPDIERLGAFVTSMAQAGLLSPNRPLEAKLLTAANLPPPEDADMEIFDDPSVPTPATTGDLANGLLSERQVDAVVRINAAVAEKKMPYEAAVQLLAVTLGMSPDQVKRFLGPEVRELPEPQVLPPQPMPKSFPKLEGEDAP